MRALRAFTFVAASVALTAGAIEIGARVRVGELSLLQAVTRTFVKPGGRYYSLARFREADAAGPVDVVVFGSSHAYRGFDPRMFAAAGYSMMNLGSTNQTPLNSYYLAKRYLPRLRPELVIYEVYYQSLASDGLESCRDLAVNSRASLELLEMSAATWNIGATVYASAKELRAVRDPMSIQQADIAGETYVPGGYVESDGRRDKLLTGDSFSFEPKKEQLEYLERLTWRAKNDGADVVWVTHPLPTDHLARIAGYPRIKAQIESAAREAGVRYWDFNDDLTLDPLDDFTDFHHLSARGVKKFDAALLARLEREITRRGR